MLTDGFGRKFYYLRLSVTDVCNFRCSYCLPDGNTSNNKHFLTTDEVRRLVSAFASLGTEKIRLTGGEPSLRKDLPEMIRICKQTPGIKTVAITSNGYKLPDVIEEYIDAGLDALNISIDSLDARQFHAITGRDKLDTILAGIDKARSLGLTNIKINSVLLKQSNVNQLPTFLNWLKDNPVTLRFIELMETGDNNTFFQEQHYSGANVQDMLVEQDWIPTTRDKTAGPAIEYMHPDYAGKVGLIMPYSKGFCDTCNRLRVSAMGNLHLCLFSEQGISLRDYLQTDDTQPLIDILQKYVSDKGASHMLQQGFTGATQHLAMLGG